MSEEDNEGREEIARDREEIGKIMAVENYSGHKMKTQEQLLTDTSQGGSKCPGT